MAAQYRVVTGPSDPGGSSRQLQIQVQTITADKADNVNKADRASRADEAVSWVDLDRWRAEVRDADDDPELFADDLAAAVAKHGWRLGKPVPAGTDNTPGWAVTPLDWRQIIALGTQTRREAAEQAAQVDRGWQTMIADVPSSRVSVIEISAIAGLTRARIHTIRRAADNPAGSNSRQQRNPGDDQ